jgi:predicted transcriptional regulator
MSTENLITEVDNRDIITEHLKGIERDLAWLQRKTDIPYATLYSCFVQRLFKVSKKNLRKINKALETDFK